jgi:hypothetical protein
MNNSFLDEWLNDDGYFDALAILSMGTLHPGRWRPNTILASRLDWADCEVLEIGAGNGLSHRFFSSLGATVTSVEPNKWMRYAAVHDGTPPSRILALPAESLDSEWLSGRCSKARVLVQGVTAFLSQGLHTLKPILEHPGVREVVFVEWFGASEEFGSAPLCGTHEISDYIRSIETAGFKSMWLETAHYISDGSGIPHSSLKERIEHYFPEATEIAWRDRLARKLSVIKRAGDRQKDYFMLWASK